MSFSQKEILDFWFVETSPEQWFQKSEAFDRSIRDRFLARYADVLAGKYDEWATTPKGVLALIIILDQFSRNMFRDTPAAFTADDKALALAKKAVEAGLDQQLNPKECFFIYLPFEHSEDMANQLKSVELFAQIKDQEPVGYEYALRHLKVIEQFGRFPHRNAILGRASTQAELEYLEQPGAGF